MASIFACAAPIRAGEIELEAERLSAPDDRTIRAEGEAHLQRRGGKESLRADSIEYDRIGEEVRAEGKIEFADPSGGLMRGTRLRYSLSEKIGEVDEPSFILPRDEGRVTGRRLRLLGDGRYHLRDGEFTTCPVESEDWKISVSALELDPAANVAVARSARLEIRGVPIFYLPRFSFQLDRSRKKSGFLTPSFGFREAGGLELEAPLYFYLADNYDATFSPRFISERGLLLRGDFRYLIPRANGDARIEFLSDDKFNDSRRYWRFSHLTKGGGGDSSRWSWGGELERVSDDDYFEDVGEDVDLIARRHFPRRGFAEYRRDNWHARIDAEQFQTIRRDASPPHDVLPRLSLFHRRKIAKGWTLQSDAEFANFRRAEATQAEGKRLRLNFSASRPYAVGPLHLTPRIAWHAAHYHLDSNSINGLMASKTPGYTAPSLELDSGINLVRGEGGGVLGEDLQQSLGLRLLYVYAPRHGQSDIPLFDTAVADANVDRLFAWNRFSGGDRINDADFLSYGAAWRIWHPRREREIFTMEAAQRYHFHLPQITLDSAEEPDASHISPLLFALKASPSEKWESALEFEWNPDGGALESIEFDARARIGRGGVEFRYARLSSIEDDETASLGLYSPFAQRWEAAGEINYDLDNNRIFAGAIGIGYRGGCGCWRASFVAERHLVDTDENRASFFFRVELTGLGGFGADKLDRMVQNIRGE